MKKIIALLTSATIISVTVVGLVASNVSAQEEQTQNSQIVIQQPQDGATVGTVFTVSGTYNSACGMYNEVFIYNDSQSRYYFVPVTPLERSNTFSYRIDTRQALNSPEFYEGKQTPELPPDGKYTVTVSPREFTCTVDFDAATNRAEITLRHDSSDLTPRGKPVAQSSPPPAITKSSPTPTPTPSATLTPDVIAAPAEKNELPPSTIFLIGALIGAALLSLSEVSALSYLKKHPKKK